MAQYINRLEAATTFVHFSFSAPYNTTSHSRIVIISGMSHSIMVGASLAMVSVSVSVLVPPVLVALRVIKNFPVIVGMPVITPVVALSDKPGGKPVASKLVGVFEAVIV